MIMSLDPKSWDPRNLLEPRRMISEAHCEVQIPFSVIAVETQGMLTDFIVSLCVFSSHSWNA